MHRPQVRSGLDIRSRLQRVMDCVVGSSAGLLQLLSLCSVPAMSYGRRKLACSVEPLHSWLCFDGDPIGYSKVSEDSYDVLSGIWSDGWEKPSRRPRKLSGGCEKPRHPHTACVCPRRCAVHLH